MPTHHRVVWAVFKRNFSSYFINPTGYVFITVFILLGAIAAFWQESFFLNNLANLDRLNDYFPMLLLFFIPALTMNIWSEERRQGTDELLFTLPGHDSDIVLGKYLAALGIYTVAVLFSLSHLAILTYLGDPDVGLILATYLGYWLAGAALLAVGMVASLLTANATVAFILGAIFCAFFVFIHFAENVLGPTLGSFAHMAGLVPHFQAFGDGSVPPESILYFVALTVVMLYVNVALVGRRHSSGGESAAGQTLHWVARSLGLAVAAVSLCVLVGRLGLSLDFTAERLHTLQPQTQDVVDAIPKDRPVYIQAYFSPEVPDSHVQTRKDLINLLRKLDQVGGDRIHLNLVDTEPYTEEATRASENYKIEPRKLLAVSGGQRAGQDVFMGLVFNSGPEEFVIPFFDRGLPVEYELARSIRVVSQTQRKKLGVVSTDAGLFGGFDFQSMSSNPDWSVVRELRKQYDVEQVQAAGPYPADLDVLMVVLPSSLTQEEMDVLQEAMLAGKPTLLLDDPLPLFNHNLAPDLPKDSGRNPFMNQGRPPPQPKGNIEGLLASIGLSWQKTIIVWSDYNPHPAIADAPPQVMFVSKSPANPQPFNMQSPITAGLQEVVLMFAGWLQPAAGAGDGLKYVPLLKAGITTGTSRSDDMLVRSFLGVQLNLRARRLQTGQDYTLALHVTGTPGAGPKPTADGQEAPAGDKRAINVIAVADADVISETFFDLRRQGFEQFNFDNVTFVLNCIDDLAGDESFIELRKHRPHHRTLARLEGQSQQYVDKRRAQDDQAEAQAEQKLAEARGRLDEKLSELRQRELDERTKGIMLATLEKAENRRLEVARTNIEAEKDRQMRKARAEMERAISAIQRRVKWLAAILPPIPTLLLAVLLFAYRYKRENVGVPERRLVGDSTP